jgi:phosphoribosylaminoimidazole-succinocarboxamide synthase
MISHYRCSELREVKMLSSEAILQAVPHALDKFEVPGDIPHGKTRDFYVTADGKQRVLIATDRLSVFDHLVGLVPYKGQILNALSAWWFKATGDLIPNHFVAMPDPNVMIAREARPILLAVIGRGYITGVTPTSLWPRYEAGEREIYGLKFPDGLRKNDRLPQHIVTPTTKSTVGREDRQVVTDTEIQKYLSGEVWQQVQAAALALYARGQEIAARAGLVLVDSKYEFGFDLQTQALMLIDEIHTPDSSRYWKADTYAQRIAAGREPENLDKELARLWYGTQSYRGQDPYPPLNDDLIVSISQAYQQVYERITGETFVPAVYPAQDRIEAAIAELV